MEAYKKFKESAGGEAEGEAEDVNKKVFVPAAAWYWYYDCLCAWASQLPLLPLLPLLLLLPIQVDVASVGTDHIDDAAVGVATVVMT